MSVYRKDKNGNLIKIAGSLTHRVNNIIFRTSHTVENNADYYTIDETEAAPYITGLSDNTNFWIYADISNVTETVYLRYKEQILQLAISDNTLIPVNSITGKIDLYTLNSSITGIINMSLSKSGEGSSNGSNVVMLLGADCIIEENRVICKVQDAESFKELLVNQARFLLTGALPLVGEVDDNLPINIEFGDTVYNVYSFMSGGDTPLTFGDIRSVTSYNEATGYFFYPTIIFIETSDITGFVLEPNVFTAKQLFEIIKDSDSISVELDETGTKLLFKGSSSSKIIAIENETVTENEFKGIIKLSEEQYEELYAKGTIEINGIVINYNDGVIYVTDNKLPELSLIQNGTMLVSEKTFSEHIQVLLEFETDGMHYGVDFVLHPYDSSICIVSYNFVGHSGTAYVDEGGHVNISIPDNLIFTNVKAHYVSLGG